MRKVEGRESSSGAMRFAFPYDTEPFRRSRPLLCYGVVDAWALPGSPAALHVNGRPPVQLDREGEIPPSLDLIANDLREGQHALRLSVVARAAGEEPWSGRLVPPESMNPSSAWGHVGRSHELALWLAWRRRFEDAPPADDGPLLFCSGVVSRRADGPTDSSQRERASAAEGRISLAAKWLTYCAVCADGTPTLPFAMTEEDGAMLLLGFRGMNALSATDRLLGDLGAGGRPEVIRAILELFAWTAPVEASLGDLSLRLPGPRLVALPSPTAHELAATTLDL